MSDPSQWQASSQSDQQHHVNMNQQYLYNRSLPLQLRPLQPNPNPTREHNLYPFSASSMTETEQNKESKRIRVSRACDACRRRKIKCENIAPGEACKSCKASSIECTFKDSAKKRGPPKGYIEVLENRLKKMEKLLGGLTNEFDEEKEDIPSKRIKKRRNQKVTQAFEHDDVTLPVESGTLTDSPNKEPEQLTYELSSLNTGLNARYIGDMSPLPLLAQKVNFEDVRIASKIGFKIRRFGQSLVIYEKDGKTDKHNSLRLLERMGKLRPGETIKSLNDWIYKVTGLDKRTSDALMKIYFAYIHPGLPVINKQLFLKQYRGQIVEYPSAPLLNAIYGASVRYINTCRTFGDELSFDHPIEIKENWSEYLFENVSAYVRGKYYPCLPTVQAVVIVQNHLASLDEKVGSTWLLASGATRAAQDLGLHRSSECWDLPTSEKETRRRVWSAVYIMDKWSAAATGRPQTIFDEDCDEVYPSESADWDEVMDVKHEDDDDDEPRFPSLDEKVAQKAKRGTIPIYQPFVQLVKLSEILGKLLQGLYTPLAKKHSEKHGSDAIVTYLDNALSEWRTALPPALQISSTNVHRLNNRGQTPLISMSGLMYLAYCTLLILLHRPFIEKEGSQKTRSAQTSFSICTSAATQCVEIVEKMHYRDFLLVSWNFSIYPLFTAILIHINNASHADNIVSDVAKSHLIRANDVLKRLSRLSLAADQLSNIIHQLIIDRDITFEKLVLECDTKSKKPAKSKKTANKVQETASPTLVSSDAEVIPSCQSTPNSLTNGDWINGLYSCLQTETATTSSETQPPPMNTNANLVESLPYSLRQFGIYTDQTYSPHNQSRRLHVPCQSNMNDSTQSQMMMNPADSVLFGMSDVGFSTSVNMQPYMQSSVEPTLNNDCQLNSLIDNSSVFRHRPENPFWSMPSSMELDDWTAYFLPQQQQQQQSASWHNHLY